MPKKTPYGGRWKVVRSLSAGGQGEIYMVSDLAEEFADECVLKRLRNNKRLGRFEREIRALQELQSPHISPILDHRVDSPAYLVTPYLGPSLVKFAGSRQLSIEEGLRLYCDAVEGVRDAHSSNPPIVHRDIKPTNVVVLPDGSSASVIDFGLCQFLDNETVALTTDEAFGNSAFAAPECLAGREEEPGTACDVYSLGKLLYWMLSWGEHIQRENLSNDRLAKIRTDSAFIRSYINRLLKNTIIESPNERWSASQLLEETNRTIGLLGRLGDYEGRGLHVLYDRFGLENEHSKSSIHRITRDYGEGGETMDFAIRFEVPSTCNVQLDSIQVAAHWQEGTPELGLTIMGNNGSEPGGESVGQAQIACPRDRGAVVQSVGFDPGSILERGKDYWLVFSAGSQGNIGVWGAPLYMRPWPTEFAKRVEGVWRPAVSETGPGPAVRILARDV